MARVVFELKSGRDGVMQLRDCAFTDEWKRVFKHNRPLGIQDNRGQSYARRIEGHKYSDLASDIKLPDEEHRLIKSISSGISYVESVHVPWSRSRPSMFMDWSVTNDIHRGFTTLSLTQCTDRVDLTHDEKNALMVEQYNFNGVCDDVHGSKFLLQYKTDIPRKHWQINDNSTQEEFIRNLHKINSGVHDIENRCRVSPRELAVENSVYPEHAGCRIPMLDWDTKGSFDNRTDIVKADFNLGDVANGAVDNNPYWNVYDLKNILGKDYLTAYYNYDDPGEWDVCNHFKTTKGGFMIAPHLHRIVNHVLVPWIREWGYQASPEIVSPIQIGHIDEEEVLSMCTPNDSNSWDVSHSGNDIVRVDLID